jgi:hypothetical protein
VKHYFARGLGIAREQEAKSLELRLWLSICDLSERGKKADKHYSELRYIYGFFSEGFDTADLVKARARLEREGHSTS